MSDPTAAEAVAEVLWRDYLDTGLVDSWSSYGATRGDATIAARDVLDALGIDPDAPLSLLHWHAAQQERERCARIAEVHDLAGFGDDFDAGYKQAVRNITTAIRRSDRL